MFKCMDNIKFADSKLSLIQKAK